MVFSPRSWWRLGSVVQQIQGLPALSVGREPDRALYNGIFRVGQFSAIVKASLCAAKSP